MFSRSIRILVIVSLIFVIAANFVFFSVSQDAFDNNQQWGSFFVYAHNNNHYEYRGFKYFMEYLQTFPGLQNSINTVNNVAGVLSMQIKYTGWTVADWFIGILMILGSPVQLLICFVLDIVNNLIWLFSFFLPHVFS